MPVTIPLDANYWTQDVVIEFQLVDQYERPYPAEITAATGFVAGIKRVTVGAAGASITLPYNDEVPTPPGQAASSRWLINVVGDRISKRYLSGIVSTAPITTWNELIGTSGDVDADSVFEGRLLPDDAETGEYARKAAVGWEAVALSIPCADISDGTAAGCAIVTAADAAAQRVAMDVDQAGADNSTNVTLAGAPDYITIAGQVITRGQIDLATDVTGALPWGSLSGTPTTLAGYGITDGITNVVDDTTPQLGGDLDVNGASIVSVSNGDITIAPDGTGKIIAGRFSIDGYKIISDNDVQLLYNAADNGFSGSIFLGSGGSLLSHTAAQEGYHNVGIGSGAAANVTTGYQNTAVGRLAGNSLGTGYANTFIGYVSSYFGTGAHNNVSIGYNALYRNVSGTLNVAVGNRAIQGAAGESPSRNAAFGHKAGFALITNGDNNSCIGYSAGSNITSGAFNIVIGADQSAASATASYQLNIGGVITGSVSGGSGGIALESQLSDGVGAVAHVLDTKNTLTLADVLALRVNGSDVVTVDNAGSLSCVGLDTGSGNVGFHSVTPAAQQSHISDPSGGATVDAEARSAIAAILAVLETYGLTANA